MTAHKQIFDSIAKQRDAMIRLVMQWSSINSHTLNVEGLRTQRESIQGQFRALDVCEEVLDLNPVDSVDAQGHAVSLPLGKMLIYRKRPEAAFKILLGIHMDTVFPADHVFQKPVMKDPNTVVGPGVLDAKGGLVVLLKTLEAFEAATHGQSPLGWTVFVNPDEEMGSPGSRHMLAALARDHQAGLVYEPCLPDGRLIHQRKGSGYYRLICRGRSAHVGRHPEAGRNAIFALSRFLSRLEHWGKDMTGCLINAGRIEGGTAANVIPDFAMAQVNIRVPDCAAQQCFEEHWLTLIDEANKEDGIQFEFYGEFSSPPKKFDTATQEIFELVKACGQDLGLSLDWTASGGTCDGNKLAAAGLPTIDTLGPCGGELHSSNEYIDLDSLVQRTQLSTRLLLKWHEEKQHESLP